MDQMHTIPTGEVVAEFGDYTSAQDMVNTLVNGGVHAHAVSIVGADVTLVERVVAKVGYGRAALQFAANGSWLGLLVGLIVVVFSPDDVVTPILAGLLIGAGAGMVVGMLIYTLQKGPKRSYRSVQHAIAATYRVVVSPNAHSDAVKAIAASSKEES